MSEDLTRLARWLIPGWLALFTFWAFLSLDAFLASSEDTLTNNFYEWMERVFPEGDLSAGLIALMVAIIGISVGFFVYQAYFYFRWNSPISRDGFFVFQGRMAEFQRLTWGVDDDALRFGDNGGWRSKIIDHVLYKIDHAFKERYLHFVFMEAVQVLDRPVEVELYDRYRYLHEIMHILGASIVSVTLGFFGYWILWFQFRASNFANVLFGLIGVPIFIFVMSMLLEWEQKFRDRMLTEPKQRLKLWCYPLSIIPNPLHKSSDSGSELPSRRWYWAFPSFMIMFGCVLIHLYFNPYFVQPILESLLRGQVLILFGVSPLAGILVFVGVLLLLEKCKNPKWCVVLYLLMAGVASLAIGAVLYLAPLRIGQLFRGILVFLVFLYIMASSVWCLFRQPSLSSIQRMTAVYVSAIVITVGIYWARNQLLGSSNVGLLFLGWAKILYATFWMMLVFLGHMGFLVTSYAKKECKLVQDAHEDRERERSFRGIIKGLRRGIISFLTVMFGIPFASTLLNMFLDVGVKRGYVSPETLEFLASSLEIDWVFLSVFTVYLIIITILFHNRKNARDDLLALMRFVICKYIYEGVHTQASVVKMTKGPKRGIQGG